MEVVRLSETLVTYVVLDGSGAMLQVGSNPDEVIDWVSLSPDVKMEIDPISKKCCCPVIKNSGR
jgi:hypothetical protein